MHFGDEPAHGKHCNHCGKEDMVRAGNATGLVMEDFLSRLREQMLVRLLDVSLRSLCLPKSNRNF
jgi:hypothetical protein